MSTLATARTTLRALPTMFRVGWADIVAYRAEMVIWILTSSMPLVMLALWNAAAADGPIGRFGQAEFARYFAVNLVVRQITGGWIMWEMNWLIRSGGLSPWLLKPVPMPLYNLSMTLAAIPFRLVVLAPMLGALVWWRPEVAFAPSLETLLLFGVSLALAWVLSWLIQLVFGILAFWMEQTSGLFAAYFAVWSLLSGYFLPLELLPSGVEKVSRFLPFHPSMGAPVDLLLGADAHPARTLGLQAAWIAAAYALVRLLWARGIKRYGAYGA